ncbi:hypothetical protein CAPTEDRAFT_194119 [Capitella teleta]|uniref:LRRCT domain-containing protein n=1 Tax=Capitella teleta TaxID=283909 RepID=R7U4S0_CAPTE|nr:hypothetical protein CAPTEDRAFT_194119 [Capitella teleta]|eukprot:ELU00924.1 hypothetical protein CAPTEDRAFT_194119 [Capitella teleta]
MEEVPKLLWLLLCLLDFAESVELAFINQGLSSLPDNITENVTSLNCGQNAITEILQSDFNDKYPHLEFLYLRDNQIRFIDNGSFKGTKLRLIFLQSNQLSAIPDFHQVKTTLRYLSLRSNQITQIRDVNYISNLNTLVLSNNLITQLPDIRQHLPPGTILHVEDIPLECCCVSVWLTQLSTNQTGVVLSPNPCKLPSSWTLTQLNNLTEAMFLRQPCEIKTSQKYLCVHCDVELRSKQEHDYP